MNLVFLHTRRETISARPERYPCFSVMHCPFGRCAARTILDAKTFVPVCHGSWPHTFVHVFHGTSPHTAKESREVGNSFPYVQKHTIYPRRKIDFSGSEQG
jgi:hypothetical protein